MRHLCVGEHEEQERRPRGREETDVAWERRKAEQDARKAAVMADPVLGFYARHGHPAGRQAEVAADVPGELEDADPGTA